MPRRALAAAAALLLGLALPTAAPADHFVVYPSGPTPYGNTGELANAWWQWAFSIPANQSPFLDEMGENAHVNNNGPVFFLAGKFGLIDPNGAFFATANRTVTVPPGTPLFFPILNGEFDNIGTPEASLLTEAEMRQILADQAANAQGLFLTIDGEPVSNLATAHRETGTPAFDILFPDNNLYQFFGLDVPAGLYRADDFAFPNGNPQNGFTNSPVQDGFYVLVAPLDPGRHTIHFGGSFGEPGTPGSFTLDITYNILVGVPEPSTVALLAVGVAGLAGYGRWRRRRRTT
jgi:hypothetical protein